MSGIFEDEALERDHTRRDTELTLGSGMLLGVFFGLVLICGLCFGMGYALGARGSKGPVFQSQPPAAGPAPQMPGDSFQGKPSAAAQPPTQQQTATSVQPAPVQGAAPGTTAATPATSQTPIQTPTQAPNDGGWQAVQPAMPGAPGGTQTVQPAANSVQPAMPSQNSLMVQIAAVSDAEDASVLVGALRKRGYSVSANRNPADNLIHVCIGPFSNRNDANAMRQKLLNDGYNAIVLP